MHIMSEEAFELDLMKECETQLGFELYDATSEIIGGENNIQNWITQNRLADQLDIQNSKLKNGKVLQQGAAI